jgi:hypothetical protein
MNALYRLIDNCSTISWRQEKVEDTKVAIRSHNLNSGNVITKRKMIKRQTIVDKILLRKL